MIILESLEVRKERKNMPRLTNNNEQNSDIFHKHKISKTTSTRCMSAKRCMASKENSCYPSNMYVYQKMKHINFPNSHTVKPSKTTLHICISIKQKLYIYNYINPSHSSSFIYVFNYLCIFTNY